MGVVKKKFEKYKLLRFFKDNRLAKIKEWLSLMEKIRTITRFDRVEKRLYEILGIKLFKSLMLYIEKIKHRKDGLSNENYHIKSMAMCSLKKFSGYLLYNAIFHIVSLFFVAIYFVIVLLTKPNLLWFNIVMCVVAIIDLYCIMLQRYSFLRIKAILSYRQNKKAHWMQNVIEKLQTELSRFPLNSLVEDYELISRIHHCALEGTACLILETDIPSLQRIAQHLLCCESNPHAKNRDLQTETANSSAISKLPESVRSAKERCVSSLQKAFHINKTQNICFGFYVITETTPAELAYSAVFPAYSRDSMEIMIAILFAAYQETITRQKGSPSEHE